MSSFGTIPPEPPRQNRLADLAPKFAVAVGATLERLTGSGFDPVIYEALRSQERQTWLYGFGRDYDDGRGVVTHVDNVESGWHVFGLAVDIISEAHGWDSSAFFDALQVAAEAEGLTSGSSWRMRDRPHVQWGAPMRASPSAEAATLFAQGGNPAVWAAEEAL